MPVKSNLKEFFVLLYQANRGVKKHINTSTCHGIPTTLSPSSTYFAGLCLKFLAICNIKLHDVEKRRGGNVLFLQEC